MASCNLTMVTTPLTPTVDKGNLFSIKRSVFVASKIKKPVVTPLQVKCEKGHIGSTAKSSFVSRRYVMQCLTTGVLGLALLPKPAEARIGRLEMKKMIMDKLRELREKAGLSKPKPNTENGIKPPTTSSPENKKTEDKKSPTSQSPSPENKKSEDKKPEDKKSPTSPSPSPEDKKSPKLPLATNASVRHS